MVTTGEDFKNAGIEVPVLVGGAALSLGFTRRKIIPAYEHPVLFCKDAMTGLDTLNKLQHKDTREAMLQEGLKTEAPPVEVKKDDTPVSTTRSTEVSLDVVIPKLPTPDRKVIQDVGHLEEIWSYVNPQMLFVRHLGLKGSFDKKLADRDPKALELKATIDDLKEDMKQWMKLRAVWRYFEAEGKGNDILLFEPGADAPMHTFAFPRQRRENGLCLADYVLPPKDGRRDNLAVLVVTAGEGIIERANAAKEKGEYVRSHAIQALGLETAEAASEWLHRRFRDEWGFPDPPDMTMRDRFRAKYRGKRYSFGYPACPDLEGQTGIWKILQPEEIGVQLTEGFMMDPEASVSAIAFHHPDCTYFAV